MRALFEEGPETLFLGPMAIKHGEELHGEPSETGIIFPDEIEEKICSLGCKELVLKKACES